MIRRLAFFLILLLAASSAHADMSFVRFKKKAAGGTPPGTLLVGDNTDYVSVTQLPGLDNALYDSEGYTAAATATAVTAYVRFQSGSGNFKVAIYDSGKNLLGTSNAGTIGSGWRTATITAGPTITAGGTYYLAVIVDTTGGYTYCAGSGSGRIFLDSGGTYASPPNPLAGSNWSAIVYELGIYVTN